MNDNQHSAEMMGSRFLHSCCRGCRAATATWTSAWVVFAWAALAASFLSAQIEPKPPQEADEPEKEASSQENAPAVPAEIEAADGKAARLIRLTKEDEVWIDMQRKWVVVGGEVVLREGLLEMFACPRGTKEHESVVAVRAKAQHVHAALLAVGAKPGNPVKFQPEYVPATGTPVDIRVLWTDKDGNRHIDRAQNWVKNLRTGKAMEHTWVFAGSGFWKDEVTGEEYYYGDSGDFICVSNFPTATLDLPVRSSQANAELTFAAFTENIPPLGTKVRLVLIPQSDSKKKKPSAGAEEESQGQLPQTSARDAQEKR